MSNRPTCAWRRQQLSSRSDSEEVKRHYFLLQKTFQHLRHLQFHIKLCLTHSLPDVDLLFRDEQARGQIMGNMSWSFFFNGSWACEDCRMSNHQIDDIPQTKRIEHSNPPCKVTVESCMPKATMCRRWAKFAASERILLQYVATCRCLATAINYRREAKLCKECFAWKASKTTDVNCAVMVGHLIVLALFTSSSQRMTRSTKRLHEKKNNLRKESGSLSTESTWRALLPMKHALELFSGQRTHIHITGLQIVLSGAPLATKRIPVLCTRTLPYFRSDMFLFPIIMKMAQKQVHPFLTEAKQKNDLSQTAGHGRDSSHLRKSSQIPWCSLTATPQLQPSIHS